MQGTELPGGDIGTGLIQFWTVQSGGNTYLVGDTDGDLVFDDTDMVVRFDGLVTLDSASFVAGTFVAVPGNGNANAMPGTPGADLIFAVAGDDTIDGGDGADSLYGGSGNDTLRGGAAGDELHGEAGDDLLEGGLAADSLLGDDGQDTLRGGDGADNLYGGGAADQLYGGADRDILRGDVVNDVFWFADGDYAGLTNPTADRIVDFTQGSDRINLSLTDAEAGGADNAFAFIGSGAFTGVAGQLRTVQSAGVTLILGDTDGDGAADIAVALTGTITLQASDFVL